MKRQNLIFAFFFLLFFAKPKFMNQPKPGLYEMDDCRIIVTIDDGLWHLSISKENQSPSYEEKKRARYMFLPDNIFVGEIFPPIKYFINCHPYCHHLWQIEEKYHYYG